LHRAVLDAFLPHGGQLAGEVAGGVHEMHVGERQIGQGPVDLRRGGAAE
jgi:hypothetical protein